MKENKIKVKNHDLFYRMSGTGSEVIIFLHGIPTNSFIWIQIMNHLENKYTVIAPDLIGLGQSSRAKVDDLKLPKQAEYIISLMDQLNIEKAHFVGHDLGGGITQILAVNYPNRVSSIVVCDGVTFNNWPLPQVVAIRKPTAPEFEPNQLFIERMLRGGLYHQELATPQLLEALISPFDHLLGGKELQTLSNALDHHQIQDIVNDLPQIKVKATFIWGAHDRYIPPYWGYLLHEVIPNSNIKIIDQASHFLMIDHPIEFIKEIEKHMEKANK